MTNEETQKMLQTAQEAGQIDPRVDLGPIGTTIHTIISYAESEAKRHWEEVSALCDQHDRIRHPHDVEARPAVVTPD